MTRGELRFLHSKQKIAYSAGVLAMLVIMTLAGIQSGMFIPPVAIDLGPLGLQPDYSYASMNTSAWIVPPMRSKGFLFEVQPLDSGPFNATVENQSVVRYHLGETALYDPTGFTDGEWDYSFFHLFNGALDGAGRPSWGGYATPPANRSVALADLQRYFDNITNSEPHPWYTFTGHYTYPHYAAEWGSDSIGSEIGENINGYQQSIAFNRGAARQYNKSWFVDVSAWLAGTITDYSTVKPWGANVGGADYGHSMSLYNRTYYMSYMAGTGTLIAEAGGENFFLQQNDGSGCFLPSPLGLVGQGFYNFTLRHPDVGIPYTPFALLLDKYHGVYMGGDGQRLAFEYFPYDYGDDMTWELINEFFPGSWQNPDGERGTLVDSPWGDTCDVLLQDASASVLSSYPIVIPSGDITFLPAEITRLVNYVNAGGILVLNSAFASQFPASFIGSAYAGGYSARDVGNGALILYGNNYDVMQLGKAIINDLASIYLPFKVSGNIEYMINRRNSSWVVTLLNDNGVTKQPRDPPVIDMSKTRNVTVQYRFNNLVSIHDWITDRPVAVSTCSDGEMVMVSLPPGTLDILEFTIK